MKVSVVKPLSKRRFMTEQLIKGRVADARFVVYSYSHGDFRLLQR